MERNPDAACFNCPFWYKIPGDLPAGLAEGVTVGQCREEKPRMYMIPVRKPIGIGPKGMAYEDGIEARPLCPQTTSDFWCGAHPDLLLDDEEEQLAHPSNDP